MAREKMLAGPVLIFTAPRGTAKPTPAPTVDFDARPVMPIQTVWMPIAGGDYGAAVEANFAETKSDVRPLNETFKVKKFRAEESITYTTSMIDMLPGSLERLFHGQTVTTTAPASGVAGYEELNFERGFEVVERAVLIVGRAPYDLMATTDDDEVMIFWHPACDIEGPGTFSKDLANPSMPALMIDVIKHETLGVGGLVANNAAPGP